MTTASTTYGRPMGLEVGPAWEDRPRSVLGAIEETPAGNVALTIGRELEDQDHGLWTKTEHVVLTPDELRRFTLELAGYAGLTILEEPGLRLPKVLDAVERAEEHVTGALERLGPGASLIAALRELAVARYHGGRAPAAAVLVGFSEHAGSGRLTDAGYENPRAYDQPGSAYAGKEG